jgi:hypothetical protein
MIKIQILKYRILGKMQLINFRPIVSYRILGKIHVDKYSQ